MKQSSTKFHRILHFRREEGRQQGRGGWPPQQPRGGRLGAWARGDCALCACAGPLWVSRLGVGGAGEHERAGPPGQVQGDERGQQAGGQAAPHRGGEGHRHSPAQRWAHHQTTMHIESLVQPDTSNPCLGRKAVGSLWLYVQCMKLNSIRICT